MSDVHMGHRVGSSLKAINMPPSCWLCCLPKVSMDGGVISAPLGGLEDKRTRGVLVVVGLFVLVFRLFLADRCLVLVPEWSGVRGWDA